MTTDTSASVYTEPMLWDMHVHLDFMQDMQAMATKARQLGLGLLAVTVTPEGYIQASQNLSDEPNVCVGVGLHPWWVADGRCDEHDAEIAVSLVRTSRYVGEIGLDLSPNHVPAESLDAQVSALRAIAVACAQTSGVSSPKVLSLHAVRAAGLVLDVLEETGALANCSCIFHWFSGTSNELHRAVKAGCWFSVNEMMLQTRRGREYARQLPANRLLLETDYPPEEHAYCSAREIRASLERTVEQLTAIRSTDVRALTCENSLRILS